MNTLQKFSVAASTAVLALGVSVGSASAASLIGQTATVEYFFPTANNNIFNQTTTVTADSSDLITFGFTSLDINALSFSIFNSSNTNFLFSTSSFNGFKLSNLNFGDNSVITGALIGNKTGGFGSFDLSRISFTDDSISVNLQSLGEPNFTVRPGDRLDIGFQTAPRAVPVPGAIFGVVVAGGALMARQRKNAKAKQTVA